MSGPLRGSVGDSAFGPLPISNDCYFHGRFACEEPGRGGGAGRPRGWAPPPAALTPTCASGPTRTAATNHKQRFSTKSASHASRLVHRARESST